MTSVEAKDVCWREAQESDVAAVVTLLRDDALGAQRETAALHDYLAAFRAMARDGSNCLIVGELAGAVIATYQITFISGLSLMATRRAQVESVRVDAAMRGRRIGGLLMADAERRARVAGCALIQLTTNAQRTRAHAFYARLGFTPSHIGFKRSLIQVEGDPMANDLFNSFMRGPDEKGRFGDFGGRFVSETLMPLILSLEAEYEKAKTDDAFWAEMNDLWANYVGRPSPMYFASRLTEHLGGAKVYFKRDELNHTGAHKINNVLGQILLARRMGKTRIIAETGAGQHGVATATVCAKFGLQCVVYMGAHDVERQSPNVFRMKLLGAEVVPVTSGRGTLKDAMNDALRDWVTNVRDTFYCIGTVAGPHPYPAMVRDFQSIIGKEAKAQLQEQEGRLPDTLIAAIGGGSNAMGLFYPFLDDKDVRLIGVEAGGKGVNAKMEHCASLTGGRPGVLHGNRTYLLQDDDGQILEGFSISAGLDYPGIGPEHAWLHDIGRAEYVAITDVEALEAFKLSCALEGIIPALEPSHALAHVMKIAPDLPKDHIICMNMCGRGDKDIFTVAKHLGWEMNAPG